MSTVATPMIINVRMSMLLRPTRSPKWPNKMPPSGRATKPTEKVVYASRIEISGSWAGKNSLVKTMPATVPYRKKSYHSMVAPIRLAITTRLTSAFETCVDMWLPPISQVDTIAPIEIAGQRCPEAPQLRDLSAFSLLSDLFGSPRGFPLFDFPYPHVPPSVDTSPRAHLPGSCQPLSRRS